MLTFREFVTEAITHADIVRLRTEAGAFTKNVRRITNGRELAQVALAYETWAHNLDVFIYQRLLGVGSEYDFDRESSWAKRLRTDVWSLIIVNPFRQDTGSAGRRAWDADRGGYTGHGVALWDEAYPHFDRARTAIYAKLGRLIRAAFAAADVYFEAEAKAAHADRGLTTQLQVGGLPVTVIRNEAASSVVEPRTFLRTLEQGLVAIRRAGFGSHLTRLRFEIYLNNANMGESAGDYSHRSDTSVIRLNIWGSTTAAVVHEVGHHVQARLSDERRKVWSDFVTRSRVSFSDDDLRTLKTAFLAACHAHYREGSGYTISNLWNRHILLFIASADLRVKYQAFLVSSHGKTGKYFDVMDPMKDETTQSWEDNWRTFERAASIPFMINAPSEYSHKNEGEAFAETFTYMVLNTAPVAPLVRSVFQSVVGLRVRV